MFPIWVFPSLCSLPSVPFPFSLPSFPTRSSQWCLWLTRVPFFPSLCIPFPPLPFPLFLSLFPYWRLCPCPLSLLMIMFPPFFPIFDYAPFSFPYFWLCPDTLCPDVLMLLLQDCWKCNFCAVSAWVYGPDNYYCAQNYILKCHINLVQECPLEIMSARALLKMGARALLNNECSSPQKDGCSCPLRIMGARPHFSREHFMNLFFYDSFLYSCVFIHLFSNWVFSEWWVLVPP